MDTINEVDPQGLWRSWERASIALMRSRVRIPPGPPWLTRTSLGGKMRANREEGPMAQLGARLNGIEKVVGSNPTGSTNNEIQLTSWVS